MRRRNQRHYDTTRATPEYAVEIPSREAILKYLEAEGAPCAIKAIARGLEVDGGEALNGLTRRLYAMVRDGQLIETRSNRFGLTERMELIPGRVLGHPDGFAFVRPDQGGDDVYVAHREARRVLHGDRVLVRIAGVDDRQRPYGNVVEVLERANTEVVGRYFREGGVGFVVPDNRNINQDILIANGLETGAESGQIVIARIEQQPDARYQPLGRVVEVLGDHMAPGMEVDIAIRTHGLPVQWPEDLEPELAKVPSQVVESAIEGRKDLRDLPFVTIDGVDARDFDDAVYCKPGREGATLYVAIADVAHYVRPGTVLDAAARERGTSVYFPDRVIPMLPEVLSNGICSLNPEVDRLALVCELGFDAEGNTKRARFYDAVIRSHARLTYAEVGGWIANPEESPRGSIRAHVMALYGLYQELRTRRDERGALDIDTVEPRFVFNAERKIERIEQQTRNDAHRLIEECMVAANVAAAEFLIKHRRPGLFRIHDGPDAQRVEALRQFLGELGMHLGGGERPEAIHFAEVLKQAADRPDRHLIETVLLRSLKLAVYSPENVGHFGLALAAYAHFTSPIRRYPDLVVHRAIKAQIARVPKREDEAAEGVALGEHCSHTERRAEEATRDAVSWLKCEYMLDKVGASFPGIVSSVTSFGLFVQLDELFVEGLVHVTALPEDYYQFDAIGHRLRGRSSKREYRVGQKLTVRVARVSLDDRQIDYVLAETAAGAPRRKSRR
ncbi:MAG: ribonuclease R [Gammaproteobacteria bacterium]|nr:ribonuclease R [Gammaproteobacteria bacterium]